MLRLLRGVLHELHGAHPGPTSLARLRLLYRHLIGPAPASPPRSLQELLLRDPLSSARESTSGDVTPELRFAVQALRELRQTGVEHDRLLAITFWQYQRIRCLTYRHLVEEPGTGGLDWFSRHYERISTLRGAVDPFTFQSALEMESADLRLGSLEARTAPEPRWFQNRDLVRNVTRQAARFQPEAGHARPEVGLVLHFIKRSEVGRGSTRRLLADPRHRAFNARYGPWFHEQRQRVLAIERALRHHPELLLVLRGMDCANLELAIPTWPFVLLLSRLRAASVQASARLARMRPLWRVPPLSTTLHAGEDFRRLSEGLRRIHEPIEFGLLTSGDRIGHGIALGVEPESWAKRWHVVMQPTEERLDDLLWELTRYQQGHLPADTGRVEYVRAEAQRLIRQIHPRETPRVEHCVEARQRRHDPVLLRRLRYPFVTERAPTDPIDRLVWLYLTDTGVFERGLRPMDVLASDDEVRMLQAAQRWLRAELGRLELTIESNPSSNLLIAGMASVEEHPVFRLQPLRGRESHGPPVQVSVNVDNPLTFASRLADEFAHLYFALLRSGVSAADALAWVDEARENGWRSRFTVPASAEPDFLRQLERTAP
jgi:hypothetical protein